MVGLCKWSVGSSSSGVVLLQRAICPPKPALYLQRVGSSGGRGDGSSAGRDVCLAWGGKRQVEGKAGGNLTPLPLLFLELLPPHQVQNPGYGPALAATFLKSLHHLLL